MPARCDDPYALAYALEGLDAAIGDAWARLRDAGATHRNARRAAVSAIDADGADSEREVTRLWRVVRDLGSERRRVRAALREVPAS